MDSNSRWPNSSSGKPTTNSGGSSYSSGPKLGAKIKYSVAFILKQPVYRSITWWSTGAPQNFLEIIDTYIIKDVLFNYMRLHYSYSHN